MEHSEREFRIGFIGVSERMRSTYEMALAQRRASGLRLATPAELPEILIVDIDGVGAEKAWREYAEQHPDVRALAVSAARETVEGAVATLRKPLRLDEFLAALDRAMKDLRTTRSRAASQAKEGQAVASSMAKKHRQEAAKTHRQQAAATPSAKAAPEPAKPSASVQPTSAQAVAPPPTPTPAPAQGRESIPREAAATTSSPTEKRQNAQDGAHAVATASSAGQERAESEAAIERTVTMAVEPITQTVTLLAKPSVKPAPTAPVEASEAAKKPPPFDPADPAHWAKRRLQVDHHLLGFLRRLIYQSGDAPQEWEIHYRDEPILWISRSSKRAGLYVEEGLIERLAALIIPDDAIVIKPLSVQAARASASKPLENFLWQMAAWTYRGRYPAELDHEALYFLRRWPNLTRVAAPSQAMRLSALFVSQPMTMKYAVKELGFTPEEVFAFCAGAYCAGLLDSAKRSADSLFEPSARETTKPAQRAVLQRIVGYLRRFMAS